MKVFSTMAYLLPAVILHRINALFRKKHPLLFCCI